MDGAHKDIDINTAANRYPTCNSAGAQLSQISQAAYIPLQSSSTAINCHQVDRSYDHNSLFGFCDSNRPSGRSAASKLGNWAAKSVHVPMLPTNIER